VRLTKLISLAAVVALLAACGSSSHSTAALTPTTAKPAATTTQPIATTTTIAVPPLPTAGNPYTYSLQSGGLTRDYRLHVPPAAATGAPLPLILNLAGATQNAQLQEGQSGMDASSDKDGYLVAYPDGTRISKVLTPDPVAKDAQYGFNAGACCGDPATKKIDDVGFLLKVISDVASHTPVDLRRVYVTGMSNGGMMAYAMAAEASDHIAAIASVSGQVELQAIHPTRPVPTLEFHSVDDPIALFKGAKGAKPPTRFSVMDGIDQWVKADGCDPKPHDAAPITEAADAVPAGETPESATLVTYTGCKAGTQVALWRFTGSGHVWPGAPFNMGPKDTWILDGVGRGITLVDANEQMWQFFQSYSLPASQ
jgi:polyhydroxybutyrate depolymerase